MINSESQRNLVHMAQIRTRQVGKSVVFKGLGTTSTLTFGHDVVFFWKKSSFNKLIKTAICVNIKVLIL